MRNLVSKEADDIPEDDTWAKVVVCVCTPVNTHTHALHMHIHILKKDSDTRGTGDTAHW